MWVARARWAQVWMVVRLSDLVKLSLDQRSKPSCAVPIIYEEVVLSPQCTNLCSPGCTVQQKLNDSAYALVCCPQNGFCLSVLQGLQWTAIWCLLKILLSFFFFFFFFFFSDSLNDPEQTEKKRGKNATITLFLMFREYLRWECCSNVLITHLQSSAEFFPQTA